jgi:hypothetical protein
LLIQDGGERDKMRSLIPLALLPLLSRAGAPNFPNGPNGGNQFAGWSQGDTNIPKPTIDWTSRPNGVPTQYPSPPHNLPKPSIPPAPAAAPPAASPAPAAPGSPAATPPVVPAASPQAPTIPAPAAASSIISAITSAIGISIIPGVTPAPVPVGSAPGPAASGIGLPVPHGVPSPSDIIPAAQCSAGGPTQGQWMPFLVAHQNPDPALQCPTNNGANIHWFLDSDNIGCCPQNAYLSTAVAGQYACCACGSSCAGLPPAAFQDWSLNGMSTGFLSKPQHFTNLPLL